MEQNQNISNQKRLLDLSRTKQLEYTSNLIKLLKGFKNNESTWQDIVELRQRYELLYHNKDSLRRGVLLKELIEADCVLDPSIYIFNPNISITDSQTGEGKEAPIGTIKKEINFNSKLGDYIQTSEAILPMAQEDMSSPDKILLYHGYEPEKFDLLKCRTSLWQQNTKEDGTKNLYSSKIEVAPKKKGQDELNEESIRQVFNELIKDRSFSLEINDAVKNLENKQIINVSKKSNKTLLIMLSDCHLGRLSTVNETRKGQSLHTSISALQTNIDKWVEKFGRYNFKQIILPFGNDFLNSSFTGKTSLHGHEQDNSTTVQEIYRESAKAMILIIEKLAKIAPVYVPLVLGNHDKNEELALILMFEAYFKNDNRIIFDTSSTMRKYIKVGKNLICLSHGYNDFKKLGANMILNEASELVSPGCKSYWICGHTHHLNITKEEGNVEIWQCPAFCNKDNWTEDCGLNAKTRTTAFVFNDNEMIETHFMSV